jgi:hypothetical protein
MLDAYIIERIRREQERTRESQRPALRIPAPEPYDPRDDERPAGRPREDGERRGSVIIDYRI